MCRVQRYVVENLSKPACLVFSCVYCALCAVWTLHSAHRNLQLNKNGFSFTHISLHSTNIQRVYGNRTLPSLHGGSLQITLTVLLKRLFALNTKKYSDCCIKMKLIRFVYWSIYFCSIEFKRSGANGEIIKEKVWDQS